MSEKTAQAGEAAIIEGLDPKDGRPLRVEVANGVITAIGAGRPTTDAAWLSAGLVDLQVNGYHGHDLNSGTLSPGTVSALALSLLRSGTTTFLPTVITASESRTVDALIAIAEARRLDPLVAHMAPFVHLEGPWIAPDDGPRGAHPLAPVREPDVAEFARWQAASGGLVGMVTLSPHWPNSVDVIRQLVAGGVQVAIGHTTASVDQVVDAVAAGASLCTHLGNGMHPKIDRRRNAFWPQLADDSLTGCFIADGHHLTTHLLKVMLRAKGLERSLIVSDLTALGAMPPGEYEASIGGPVVLTTEGRLAMNDGTGQFLAGAALPLIAGVATLVRDIGLGLDEALALATVNPGRRVGGRGRLEIGAPADLIRFEWNGADRVPRVSGLWIEGRAIVP